jgi:hypothetical protein
MKNVFKMLFVFALGGLLLTYSGCKSKKETAVPVTDTQIDLLSHTWKISTAANAVTLNNNAQTNFSTFTITFTGTHGTNTVSYTCEGRTFPSVWEGTGSFTFSSANPQTQMTRDDAVAFTYAVTSSQLQMSFSFDPSAPGYTARTADLGGAWVFTMVPQ